MALSHPFLDEALYEVGPDIFIFRRKDDPSILYHIFNIYYALQVKHCMILMMAEMCLAKYGLGCDCDRFHMATDAFRCCGRKVMDAIAIDEDIQTEIKMLMKEHCEEIFPQTNVDDFFAVREPFKTSIIKDQWLSDIIDVLETMLLPWAAPRHSMQ